MRNELAIEKIVRQRSIDGQRSPPLEFPLGIYDKLTVVPFPCQRSFLGAGTLNQQSLTRMADGGGMRLINGNNRSSHSSFSICTPDRCGTSQDSSALELLCYFERKAIPIKAPSVNLVIQRHVAAQAQMTQL